MEHWTNYNQNPQVSYYETKGQQNMIHEFEIRLGQMSLQKCYNTFIYIGSKCHMFGGERGSGFFLRLHLLGDHSERAIHLGDYS